MKRKINPPEHDIDAAYDSLKDATLDELWLKRDYCDGWRG